MKMKRFSGWYLNADNTREFTNNNFVANDARLAADSTLQTMIFPVNNIFAYTAGGNGATLFSTVRGIPLITMTAMTPARNWSAPITLGVKTYR